MKRLKVEKIEREFKVEGVEKVSGLRLKGNWKLKKLKAEVELKVLKVLIKRFRKRENKIFV